MIHLIDNESVIFDPEDLTIITKYKWKIVYKNDVPYVYTNVKGMTLYLAREILKASKNQIVDHINGDTLDNRKCNLRFVNKMQNAQNMKSHKDSSSKYKGVCWDNDRKKWRCTIKFNNKQIQVGRYANELDAAKAYNQAALTYFGEFAKINKL